MTEEQIDLLIDKILDITSESEEGGFVYFRDLEYLLRKELTK